MKILFALNSGDPGGVEQYVLDLVKGLTARGHLVYVVCQEGPIVDWYEKAGAKVTKLKLRFEIDPIYITVLSRYLRKEKIDIVHANELKAGANSLIAAYLVGVRVRITHIHTPMSEWKVDGGLRKIYTKLEIYFYKTLVNLFASKEIALTQSRKRIKIAEGINPEKIEVIPNGVDFKIFSISEEQKNKYRNEILAKYSISDDKIIIGNVSRMTEEKGHDVLIRAFCSLVGNPEFGNKIHLLLAGGGKLEKHYRDLIKSLGIEHSVSITGVFDRDDLIKYYSSFDIFVFPSLAEGFGIVLIEALSMGIPIISSDLEVLREVGDDHVTNFRTGNATDLTAKIVGVLRDLKVCKERAQTYGKKYVEDNYSMEKFVQNYIKLYESLNARATGSI